VLTLGAVVALGSLTACSGSGSTGLPPAVSSAVAAQSSVPATPGSVPATSAAPGSAIDGLVASGGFTGAVDGPFTCTSSGSRQQLVQVTATPGTGLLLTVDGGVLNGSLVSKGFAGSPLKGSLVVGAGHATVTNVSIPRLLGGDPVVLNGTVSCSA